MPRQKRTQHDVPIITGTGTTPGQGFEAGMFWGGSGSENFFPRLRLLRTKLFCTFFEVLKYVLKQLVTLVYIVASLYFTQEKISKEVMYRYHTVCVNYEVKI